MKPGKPGHLCSVGDRLTFVRSGETGVVTEVGSDCYRVRWTSSLDGVYFENELRTALDSGIVVISS